MEGVRAGLIITFLPLSSDFDVFLSSLSRAAQFQLSATERGGRADQNVGAENKNTSMSALLKGWWVSSRLKPMLINICVCARSRVMHPREQHQRPPPPTHLSHTNPTPAPRLLLVFCCLLPTCALLLGP